MRVDRCASRAGFETAEVESPLCLWPCFFHLQILATAVHLPRDRLQNRCLEQKQGRTLDVSRDLMKGEEGRALDVRAQHCRLEKQQQQVLMIYDDVKSHVEQEVVKQGYSN